jgi:hypothetical protein
MSVQDIIYITPQEFQSSKQNAVVCDKIADLYRNLLSGYDCFTKPDLVLLKFPSTLKPHGKSNGQLNSGGNEGKNNKNYNNDKKPYSYRGGFQSTKFNIHQNTSTQHHQHNQHPHMTQNSKRPQLKALNNNGQDPHATAKRQLKGYLNIINKNNFKKILSKIKPIVTDDNITIITEIILDTACCQVFYVSIFYNLLLEIRDTGSEAGKITIEEQITKYVNDYINEELYLYKGALCQGGTAENKYLDFCILQKHKSHSGSRNLVIIELIKNKHCFEWTLQSYCDNLLLTISNLEYGLVEDNVETNIDIIISMIKTLKTKDKTIRISSNSIDNLRKLLNNSQRLKFMVEDIAK